jgi:hypothetical protein
LNLFVGKESISSSEDYARLSVGFNKLESYYKLLAAIILLGLEIRKVATVKVSTATR